MTPPRNAEKFGTVEPKSQWSATYKRIFNTFPQYDFVGRSVNHRYDLPPEDHYAEIGPRAQSAPPTTPAPSLPANPPLHIPPTVSTSSLSPQSILRSESSPRSRKRVSICDVAHDNRVSQEIAIRRALNREDVEDFLVDISKKEFPGGGHVEVTSQPPSDACFDSLMKMSSEDKTIYVSLRQLFSVADSRDKLTPPGAQTEKNSYEKKPVVRLDSNATTTSYASTRTSEFEEMKAVKGLLKFDEDIKEKEDEVQTDKGTCHTRESNWTTSKTWTPERTPHSKENPQKPENPNNPHLISVVRDKVERGLVLDWPDLFVLKTFHCATVQPMEETFFRSYLVGMEALDLQKQLDLEYSAYERILRDVRVSPGSYTSLAHAICLADAYWFHARVLLIMPEQERYYRKAIDEYSNLLIRAEKSLPPDNISLLHVAEKTATLLAESKNFDPDLVMRAALLVDRAERALEVKPEASARKKARRLKARLAELNQHCQILV